MGENIWHNWPVGLPEIANTIHEIQGLLEKLSEWWYVESYLKKGGPREINLLQEENHFTNDGWENEGEITLKAILNPIDYSIPWLWSSRRW